MKEIEIINKRKIFMMLSLIAVISTIFILIINKGVNLGLDFTGGTVIQLKAFKSSISVNELRKQLLETGLLNIEIQEILSHNNQNNYAEFIIKTKFSKENLMEQIQNAFEKLAIPYEIVRVEYVGPAIGKYLTNKAILAILFSLLGIIIYVAIRFGSSVWGIAGVIALIHDVFLTVGFLTLLGKEITLTVISALLTLAGYSINDTIVIFDRIRENLKLFRKDNMEKVMNISVNQTLTRTLLTSATTLMAIISLFVLGNNVIKDFALTLLFGIIVGTYSSIFIASALVLEYNLLKTSKK